MAEDAKYKSTPQSWNQWFREWLATIVVVTSLIAVTVLSALAIFSSKDEQAKAILTMVLPMVGTWVGTVLAFYFGKEQLEAATRSVTAIARELTPEEKLRSIKVTDKMIPRAEAFVITTEPGDLKLLDALDNLGKQKKGNRLPIFTVTGQARYVVHRSTIDRFIAKKAASGMSTEQLKALTMADLLKDDEFGKNLQKTFAVVSKSGTLADAKKAMESLGWCQDVFVTEAGTSAETVLGWVTNGIIEQNSRV